MINLESLSTSSSRASNREREVEVDLKISRLACVELSLSLVSKFSGNCSADLSSILSSGISLTNSSLEESVGLLFLSELGSEVTVEATDVSLTVKS